MREPSEELADLAAEGLRRNLRRLSSPQGAKVDLVGTGPCLNFSSNDYLGLATSPDLGEAFADNAVRFGTGSGASRLICGTMSPHAELEERLADFKGSAAALTFSTGFAVSLGLLPAVCGKEDIIILDKLSHASLVDGSRLSGATLRIFPHNDLEKLESHLRWASSKVGKSGRILVVTESVFSMDGDRAPLREIVALKDRYGALLLVDEAHAFGVVGPAGRGLAAELGLESEVDFQMGTLSKAAGLSGGYVCASRDWIDLLVNRARSFIYSTAPAPALAATASRALAILSGPEGDRLRHRLWENVRMIHETAESPILPTTIGANEAALGASEDLLREGFLVPAIRFPTVPRGTARLRVTVSAAHSRDDVEALVSALDRITSQYCTTA